MTGGLAYFYDADGSLPDKVNGEIVTVQRVCSAAGAAALRKLIERRAVPPPTKLWAAAPNRQERGEHDQQWHANLRNDLDSFRKPSRKDPDIDRDAQHEHRQPKTADRQNRCL